MWLSYQVYRVAPVVMDNLLLTFLDYEQASRFQALEMTGVMSFFSWKGIYINCKPAWILYCIKFCLFSTFGARSERAGRQRHIHRVTKDIESERRRFRNRVQESIQRFFEFSKLSDRFQIYRCGLLSWVQGIYNNRKWYNRICYIGTWFITGTYHGCREFARTENGIWIC